ncbi:MAG: DUF3440 domain-containing protein, partial [Bacteroidales bacterium]|nr:DUF3440 domain-containing protein [Bacteroidales bacterium]
KLSVSVRFWRDKGGVLADDTISKLQDSGIPVQVEEKSNYKTTKKPVRMDYLDDISIPEFSQIPSYKRICICILKNDHACKYMGFAPNKLEKTRRKKIMEKYKSLLGTKGTKGTKDKEASPKGVKSKEGKKTKEPKAKKKSKNGKL